MGDITGQKELSIYIHIPFCVKKCLYCDFLSSPAGEGDYRRYVEALIREIVQESGNYREYRVDTVYFGGGTPSLLPGKWVEEIMEAVSSHYRLAENCEASLEANPGTVTWEKLKSYQQAGINRLSLGAQSLKDGELEALGRIHNSADFFQSYQMAVEAGFRNLNVDLMLAIPRQSPESWRDTLGQVARLSPPPAHISAYSLIIEEGTPFHTQRPVLLEEDTERRMYRETGKFLAKYGYGQYEISNYALPGFQCRHNLAYWQRKNYAGFGIGAASLVENVRFRNIPHREGYVKNFLEEGAGIPIKEEVQRLSRQEQMEEFMFLGLRLTQGVSSKEFFRTFGVEIGQVYPGIVENFCQKGLLRVKEGPKGDSQWIALTEFGVDVSNYVMAEFLLS